MHRRELLRGAAGTAGLGLVAGCSQLSALTGGCGPGTVEIGSLPESVTEGGRGSWTADRWPRLRGTVRSVGSNALRVDDGTGVARVRPLGEFENGPFSEGDCVTGRVVAAQTDGSGEADVLVDVDDLAVA